MLMLMPFDLRTDTPADSSPGLGARKTTFALPRGMFVDNPPGIGSESEPHTIGTAPESPPG